MQQLTIENIKAASFIEKNLMRINLPLPPTPLKTEQWVATFCTLFNLRATNAEWGADRYQVTLSNSDFSAILFIEWLCDAIWIEPIGAVAEQSIYDYFFK